MASQGSGVTVLELGSCWELLRRCDVGRIAVSIDDRPEVFPINFVVDHGTLLVRTAPDSWIARCAGQPVTFEADGTENALDGSTQVWSVLLEGRARLLKDAVELLDTLGTEPLPWHASPKPSFVRIEPTVVTGRRFTRADPATWHHAMQDARRSPID